MAINRTEKRLTIRQQMSRDVGYRNRPLAVEVVRPKGFERRATEIIRNLPAILSANDIKIRVLSHYGFEVNPLTLIGKTPSEMEEVINHVDSLLCLEHQMRIGEFKFQLPEMLDVPGASFRIMRDPLKIGIFRDTMVYYYYTKKVEGRPVETLKGHNADKLLSNLNSDLPADHVLSPVNLFDQREFVGTIRRILSRNFRGMTRPEFAALPKEICEQMRGNDFFWTESQGNDAEHYELCSLNIREYITRYPSNRDPRFTIRLVEDI